MVGHVKLFINEIEALTHEMNKFGFTFVVKSELTQLVPLKAWKFMVCLYDPSTLMY